MATDTADVLAAVGQRAHVLVSPLCFRLFNVTFLAAWQVFVLTLIGRKEEPEPVNTHQAPSGTRDTESGMTPCAEHGVWGGRGGSRGQLRAVCPQAPMFVT